MLVEASVLEELAGHGILQMSRASTAMCTCGRKLPREICKPPLTLTPYPQIPC